MSSVANYIDAMHAFRTGGDKHAAVVEVARSRPGARAKKKSSLRTKVSRVRSTKPQNVSSKTEARSRVMKRKSKTKSRAAKARKRDKRGHFLKASAGRKRAKGRAARRNPVRRHKKTGRFHTLRRKGRPGKKRHVVKGHYRKASGRAAARGRKKIYVPRHMSWEEETKSMKRRKPRRKARRHAREMIVAETPKRKRRRKARRAREVVAANPVRRKKARKSSRKSSHRRKPARRRARKHARRRSSTALVRGVRRTARGGARPINVKISMTPARKAPRRRKARKATHSRKRKSGRKGKRRSSMRRLPPMNEFMANPLTFGMGEHPLSNPLSGGEMALALVTGAAGYVLTDVLDRFLATNAATPLTGTSAISAIAATPNVTRIAAQVAMVAVPMAGAYFVQHPMGRAALQGMALGAGFHLAGQLINTLVMGQLLAPGNTTIANQLYPDVVAAAGGSTGSGSTGSGSTGSGSTGSGSTGPGSTGPGSTGPGSTGPGSTGATAVANTGSTGGAQGSTGNNPGDFVSGLSGQCWASDGATPVTCIGATGGSTSPGTSGFGLGRLPSNVTPQMRAHRDIGPYATRPGVGMYQGGSQQAQQPCAPYAPSANATQNTATSGCVPCSSAAGASSAMRTAQDAVGMEGFRFGPPSLEIPD